MAGFDHGDVIILLNKWDTLLDDDEKDTFFESTKIHLDSIWKEVKPNRICKLSMHKVCTRSLFKRIYSLFIKLCVEKLAVADNE